MIAFLIAALFVGIVVVYVLPWALGLLANLPGVGSFANNKFIHLFIVGAVVVLGIFIFTKVAKEV